MVCEKEILFLDNHICAVIKPPGLVVQASPEEADSLEDRLRSFLRKKLGKENIYLSAIHRLDKPVGGIVIFAASSKALTRLQQMQKERGIQKYYLAITEGEIYPRQGILSHRLEKQEHHSKVVRTGGQEASLRYRVVKISDNNSLVSVRLHTGRYHQIRVQLSTIGHPIIGDERYGSRQIHPRQIALYHTKVIFTHPVTRKKITLISRPDFTGKDRPFSGISGRPAGHR